MESRREPDLDRSLTDRERLKSRDFRRFRVTAKFLHCEDSFLLLLFAESLLSVYLTDFLTLLHAYIDLAVAARE